MRHNAMRKDLLRLAMLALIGLLLGAIAGGVIGIGCGLVFTSVFPTRPSDADSGLLIFLTFLPIGVVSGAISGAIGLGIGGLHSRPATLNIARRETIL
jgi:hypothetical protein